MTPGDSVSAAADLVLPSRLALELSTRMDRVLLCRLKRGGLLEVVRR